ncbi:peptide/nickel transport system substrate-binding protein [Micromonospora echinofusca]|uniref:Peptide/nickel transport system substrate-binding protein n=1 Tax=Micromonospora echinofusca TaxID=47858 RepID=A0A1C5GGI4_MICEH|nr:ABC transporter substrate-binding protein [Micromonospora echinofusca]SCG18682.1 peptide/nickel transport system substrate-binding protein [Micromonospora echinofusca]
MRTRVSRRVTAVAVAGVLAVAACSSPTTTSTGAGGGTLVVATAGEPDALNPVLNFGVDGGSLIFDGLVARDARNELVPALARELPTVSADGRTVTAKLREGVLFHDGSPFTAQDVVFTYQAVLDPKVDSTLRSDLDMLASVAAPDPSTVVFTLKYAYAPFAQRLALGIVPAKALTGQDINKAEFNRKPVGTGPYRVTSWTPGDRLVLAANESYWGGRPANSGVVVAFVADDNVRAQRMRAGEFDAAELAPKLATGFDGQAGYRVQRVPTADYRGVMLPMGNPVTADLAVRRALNAAVDRAAMVTGLLGGAGEPAFGPVPPTSEFAEPSIVGRPAADPAAATAALDAAGWKPGPDGIRVRDGRQAAFALMYPATDSLRKELALAVTADAKKVGIKITPEGLTWDAITPRMKSDALVMGYGTPYDPDFVTYKLFGSAFAGQGFFNPGSYRSPVADRALQDGRANADPAARKAAYATFQKQLATDMPWVFLTYLQHTYVVKDGLAGVTPRVEPHEHDVANSLWWNIHTWTRKS